MQSRHSSGQITSSRFCEVRNKTRGGGEDGRRRMKKNIEQEEEEIRTEQGGREMETKITPVWSSKSAAWPPNLKAMQQLDMQQKRLWSLILQLRMKPEETPEQFAARLKGIVQEINDTLNVEGLCRAFKQRVQKLVDRDGDRLSH